MPKSDPVQVEVQVDADADKVFAVASDMMRMGERSPECYKTKFKGGATEVGPGVKIRGFNRRSWHWWTTTARVTEFEPGRKLSFEVTLLGIPGSQWTYEVEPQEKGCRLIERWEDKRIAPLRVGAIMWLATGSYSRAARNDETMRATLEAIKSEVESAT